MAINSRCQALEDAIKLIEGIREKSLPVSRRGQDRILEHLRLDRRFADNYDSPTMDCIVNLDHGTPWA